MRLLSEPWTQLFPSVLPLPTFFQFRLDASVFRGTTPRRPCLPAGPGGWVTSGPCILGGHWASVLVQKSLNSTRAWSMGKTAPRPPADRQTGQVHVRPAPGPGSAGGGRWGEFPPGSSGNPVCSSEDGLSGDTCPLDFPAPIAFDTFPNALQHFPGIHLGLAGKWPLGCLQIAKNSLLASETPSVLFSKPARDFRGFWFVKMSLETFFPIVP